MGALHRFLNLTPNSDVEILKISTSLECKVEFWQVAAETKQNAALCADTYLHYMLSLCIAYVLSIPSIILIGLLESLFSFLDAAFAYNLPTG